MDIDEALTTIEQKVQAIDDEESLTEAVARHKEAMELIQRCEQALRDIENDVTVQHD